MSKRSKIVLIILVAFIALEIGLCIYAKEIIKSVMNDPTSAFGDKHGHSITHNDGNEVSLNKGKINILLLGLDSNEEREEQMLGKRTDMIMLCTVDLATYEVTLTSIPRDSYAHIYKLDRSNGEVISDYYSKINTAFGAGGYEKAYGYKNTMNCVSELLSCDGKLKVHIDHYFAIDMDGITKICDALGGVEVTLDMNMYYLKSNGKNSSKLIGRKGETVSLKGEAADAFVRARKDVGGDIARVRHQQQFIMAIGKKVKSMGALSAAPKIFNEVIEFADTNLTLTQVSAMAGVLNKMNIDGIVFSTLEGSNKYIDNSSCYVIDEEDMYQKMSTLLYD